MDRDPSGSAVRADPVLACANSEPHRELTASGSGKSLGKVLAAIGIYKKRRPVSRAFRSSGEGFGHISPTRCSTGSPRFDRSSSAGGLVLGQASGVLLFGYAPQVVLSIVTVGEH